jgi:hypothetical protein
LTLDKAMPKPPPLKWREFPKHIRLLALGTGAVLVLMILVEWRFLPQAFEIPVEIAGVPYSIAFVIAMERWTKRRKRLADNLCPTCGYDLRTSMERCPECGISVPPLLNRTPRI